MQKLIGNWMQDGAIEIHVCDEEELEEHNITARDKMYYLGNGNLKVMVNGIQYVHYMTKNATEEILVQFADKLQSAVESGTFEQKFYIHRESVGTIARHNGSMPELNWQKDYAGREYYEFPVIEVYWK